MQQALQALLPKAVKHLEQTITQALELNQAQAVVIYDSRHELGLLLVEAYKQVLPQSAEFIAFEGTTPGDIRAKLDTLKPGDLVILVQTDNFRLNEFRFRIELFARKLKTIEHGHLYRLKPEQYETYINTLEYDQAFYRTMGPAIAKTLEASNRTVVRCHGGTELVYNCGMEPCKLNIGDYRGMENVGGTFPIGEVFTEAKDLSAVNGEFMIWAFADLDHIVQTPPPFKVRVENGMVKIDENVPESFKKVIALIEADEPAAVREFGCGLNRAITKQHVLGDITAFERWYGLHFSLGQKHAIYRKPGLHPKKTRYHIDVFVDVQEIEVDGKKIYENGAYQLSALTA